MRASLGYPCVTTNEIAYYIWKKVSREEVELSLPLVYMYDQNYQYVFQNPIELESINPV
jgi:hypothetical protein